MWLPSTVYSGSRRSAEVLPVNRGRLRANYLGERVGGLAGGRVVARAQVRGDFGEARVDLQLAVRRGHVLVDPPDGAVEGGGGLGLAVGEEQRAPVEVEELGVGRVERPPVRLGGHPRRLGRGR